MKKILVILGMMLLAISCVGNKGGNSSSDEKGNLKVLATTTMLTDLVRVIGGDKVEVTGLMGEGIDPHLYNPSAGDVEKMSSSDVIVYAGLHLEGKMDEVFEQMAQMNKVILNVGDSLDKSKIIYEDVETPDPHVWFDIDLWKEEAKAVADKLAEVDPENASYYQENYDKYMVELDELNTYIKNRVNEIPEESRVLVTAHDAFEYFGRAFGIEVKAIQGVSTDSEAGTKNIADLANFIVDHKIKAIFIESSIPKKSIESLQEAVESKGFNVEIGGELYSDSLGDKEHNTETYLKTMRYNIDTIVDALK